MLLSVLCIVLVIAAFVAAGIYFGLIDKDKDVQGNFDQIGNHIKTQFDKING